MTASSDNSTAPSPPSPVESAAEPIITISRELRGRRRRGGRRPRRSEQEERSVSVASATIDEEEEDCDMTLPRAPDAINNARIKSLEDESEWLEKGLARTGSGDDLPGFTRRHRGEKSSNGGWKVHVKEEGEAEDVADVPSQGLTGRDRPAFMLLVALYTLQGIPIGLTFGTLPFLLKSHLSYSQLAVFQFATWPYSLKLLWSPVVDAWFSPRIGRRKSWIVPVQLVLGAGMWIVGTRVEGWMQGEIDVRFFTGVFLAFIFAAATQDIAVDGWALTLLSKPNLSYASTAQTIGLNVGHALSFTLFLALNSVEFSNRWLRPKPLETPVVTLGGYLCFWAIVYWAFTLWLAVAKREEATLGGDDEMHVAKVYNVMWAIVRLPDVRRFLCVHLVSKLGYQVGEITSLKLIERGLPKEDLAIVSLLNVPLELVGGWVAAKWARGARPLKAWERASWARFAIALAATALVWQFPRLKDEVTGEKVQEVGVAWLAVVVVVTLMASFASTVQFVGMTAFHTQIADPVIGGTYMTLLNTMSNLGGTWPKPLVLRGIDALSSASCQITEGGEDGLRESIAVRAAECISDHGKAVCSSLGGRCVTERDGYYTMSALCVGVGILLLLAFIRPTVRRLQGGPHHPKMNGLTS